MEANICDINHLDSDFLLPPRKRLIAGLKKQHLDADADVALHSSTFASSRCSREFNTRLNNLLRSHANNPNVSPEEIVDASRCAAVTAVKIAEAARVAAEEKAAIAAKAVAAAKSALDLVASFSEDEASEEIHLKRNKLKKQVQVHLLYKTHRPVKNFKADEELAHKLHRAINSSPRISKNSSSFDSKGHKHKKLKSTTKSENGKVCVGAVALDLNPPKLNGYPTPKKVGSEVSTKEVYTTRVDEKTSNFDKAGKSEMDSEKAETSNKRERYWEDTCASGKKRGRMKLKRLPLSICTLRNQANPKEDMTNGSYLLTENNICNPTTDKVPLFSIEPSADTVMPARSIWTCKEFKAPACIKQNKVMQS